MGQWGIDSHGGMRLQSVSGGRELKGWGGGGRVVIRWNQVDVDERLSHCRGTGGG